MARVAAATLGVFLAQTAEQVNNWQAGSRLGKIYNQPCLSHLAPPAIWQPDPGNQHVWEMQRLVHLQVQMIVSAALQEEQLNTARAARARVLIMEMAFCEVLTLSSL